MQKGFLNDDEVERAINFGASICHKISKLRPGYNPWKIALLFEKVKQKGIEYFPDMPYVDMVRSIDHNFSLEDIEEAISMKHN
jgi:hypothetical protein